jgi:hypothetical protein
MATPININGCWNSVFVNDGGGTSTVLVHDNFYGDITLISSTVGFAAGSVPLNTDSMNPYYKNIYLSSVNDLFNNYTGADNNSLTLTDNNWRLAATSSFSVKTGGYISPFGGAYTTDRAGSTRTAPWSMGAYEYE